MILCQKTTSTIIHNSTTCIDVCEIDGKINIEGQILAMFLLFQLENLWELGVFWIDLRKIKCLISLKFFSGDALSNFFFLNEWIFICLQHSCNKCIVPSIFKRKIKDVRKFTLWTLKECFNRICKVFKLLSIWNDNHNKIFIFLQYATVLKLVAQIFFASELSDIKEFV